MKTRHAKRVTKVFGAILLFAGVGAAHAASLNVRAGADASQGFGTPVVHGATFADHTSFGPANGADAGSFVSSVEMPVASFGQSAADPLVLITGTGSEFSSLYRGTMQAGVVPQADTRLMLLVALGMVLYQLRRKQRSLEPPAAAPLMG